MDQEKIGKFIKAKRSEKKMTQEDLASELGVNNKTVSRWETGKYMPDLSMFPVISKVLGVSVNDLMNGEIVDKKDYQNTFEENITTVVSEVDASNRRFNKIFYGLIIFVGCVVLYFAIIIFMSNYKFSVKYNDGLLKFNQSSVTRELNYSYVNKNVSDSKYMISYYRDENNEKIGLIFIKASQTISAMLNQERYYDDCVNAKECIASRNVYTIPLDDYNVPKKYKIYYTDYSFKQIVNANDEQLKHIADKSHLVYEHMNEKADD